MTHCSVYVRVRVDCKTVVCLALVRGNTQLFSSESSGASVSGQVRLGSVGSAHPVLALFFREKTTVLQSRVGIEW